MRKADSEPGPNPVPPWQRRSIFSLQRQRWPGPQCLQPACAEGSERHGPPSAHTYRPILPASHPRHVPRSVGTQPQQHFDGKNYEESNYCCWEGIKTIFHSPRPRATSAGATLGTLRTSHPSLWPAIAGTDYSCNSPLIGSGTETAINVRHSACLPSRGCHQHRPRRAGGVLWTGPI